MKYYYYYYWAAPAGSTQRYYIAGVGGSGEEERQEIREVGVKRKCKVFCSASLIPVRKREAVNQGGTRGIDHPTGRKTQRAGIVKG